MNASSLLPGTAVLPAAIVPAQARQVPPAPYAGAFVTRLREETIAIGVAGE